MKKLISSLLICCVIFSLTSCIKVPSKKIQDGLAVLQDDLTVSYPKDPRAVMTKYGECMQALYNNELNEATFEAVVDKLMQLYDNDLLMNQTDYMMTTKQDVEQKKQDGYTLPTVVVPDSDKNVTYFSQDGYDCAGLELTFAIRDGQKTATAVYTYILRKEADTGYWKILGWKISDDQTIHLF